MPRSWLVKLAVALAALATGGGLLAAAPVPVDASPFDDKARWTRVFPGARTHWSSPVIADVNSDGSNDVVVGGLSGYVYAIDANGRDLPGFPAAAVVSGGPTAVASSPAVGDLDGDGRNEVVVGTGSLEVHNQHGGVVIFNGDGSRRCAFQTRDKFNQWTGGGPDGYSDGVFNAPAIGDIDGDGRNEVVFGAWDHQIWAIRGHCQVVGGFPFDNTDTVWSAPTLFDADNGGIAEVFIGGDATSNPAQASHSGGFMRALDPDGSTVAQRWVQLSNESYQSTGGVGDINGDGRMEIVIGSGQAYNRSDSNNVWAYHVDDGSPVPGWPVEMEGVVFLSSPALGDVDRNGTTDVVIGSRAGDIAAFRGDGRLIWRKKPGGSDEIVGSPVIADVNGDGTNEVLIGNDGHMRILDGRTGNTMTAFAEGKSGLAYKNAAAVGRLGSSAAVVTAGFEPGNFNAWISAWDIPTPRSAPWPMFRKNANRTGADVHAAVSCSSGYWLTASDGGVFSFGPKAPFHGSTGNIALNQPIVGMAAKKDRSGYWFVARDGGVFGFGAVGYAGSMGGSPLNRPIVGMAAHPSGNGYWLVASDGGIFAFNAPFHGSTGDIRLNQPIVGMAAHPKGNGYWFVAADGGVFSFGAAGFHGSMGGTRLNKPIVGMAAHPSGNGYWLVASDGGIFSFGAAKFHGSTGHIALNRPIVGMRPTPSGNGYWFVANDGGVFAFGDAQFCGSTGERRLNQPIVAMG